MSVYVIQRCDYKTTRKIDTSKAKGLTAPSIVDWFVLCQFIIPFIRVMTYRRGYFFVTFYCECTYMNVQTSLKHKNMDKELQDKAWDLLKEKGLSIGESIMVKSHFASIFKDEYPHIRADYMKGDVKYYRSEIKEISNLAFESEKEVILANAIYENVKDSFNPNEFVQMLKFTFRILGVENNWSK